MDMSARSVAARLEAPTMIPRPAISIGLCAASLFTLGLARSQSATTRVTPNAVRPGQQVRLDVRATAQRPYATWLDIAPGFLTVDRELVRLALSPAAFPLLVGQTDRSGRAQATLTTPSLPSLVGASVYVQSFVLDPSAPNGRFVATTNDSLSFHSAKSAHVERFDNPRGEAFTGDFDSIVDGRLLGASARRRSVVTADLSKGVRVTQPIAGEFDPSGARQQIVLRAVDLRARGDEEIVTALRMRPLGNFGPGRISRFAIEFAHSQVVPDFTIDPITRFPRFPMSGLARSFASNVAPGTRAQRVFDGSFTIDPRKLTARGYLPYPAFTSEFRYNGRDSLLVDFRVAAGGNTGGLGHQAYLPVPTMPRPDARINSVGVTPFRSPVTTAQRGDNALYELEVELVDVTSVVLSPWRATQQMQPRYRAPLLAAALPRGTSIDVEVRDARNVRGDGASAWTRDPSKLSRPVFQFRITLRGRAGGTRPWLEALTLPID